MNKIDSKEYKYPLYEDSQIKEVSKNLKVWLLCRSS